MCSALVLLLLASRRRGEAEYREERVVGGRAVHASAPAIAPPPERAPRPCDWL